MNVKRFKSFGDLAKDYLASSCVLNNTGTSSIEPELMVITVSGFWKHPASCINLDTKSAEIPKFVESYMACYVVEC
jgi:hypothetical protein